MSKGSRQAGAVPNQIDDKRARHVAAGDSSLPAGQLLPTSAKWFCREFAQKIEYEAGRIADRTRN